MSRPEPDTRMLVIASADDEKVFVIGEGKYVGELVPDCPPFNSLGRPNPCIELDSGEYVWGFQTWWGEAEKVKEHFKGREFVQLEGEALERFLMVHPVRENSS